jgi:hypothetical protein
VYEIYEKFIFKQMKFIIAMLGISLLYCNATSAKEDVTSNVVWVNLDIKNETKIDDDPIYEYLYKHDCPNSHLLGWFIDNSSVVQIDVNLVERAFIKNDATALAKLEKKLVRYKELPDNDGTEKVYPFGLDGIIVHSSVPKPRLMSLTTPLETINTKLKLITLKILMIKPVFKTLSVELYRITRVHHSSTLHKINGVKIKIKIKIGSVSI